MRASGAIATFSRAYMAPSHTAWARTTNTSTWRTSCTSCARTRCPPTTSWPLEVRRSALRQHQGQPDQRAVVELDFDDLARPVDDDVHVGAEIVAPHRHAESALGHLPAEITVHVVRKLGPGTSDRACRIGDRALHLDAARG